MKLAKQARKSFIIPGYEKLQHEIVQLQKTSTLLCSMPSIANLIATRGALRDTIASWGYIEIITFGPIKDQNRLERMFFWPDRKGIGQRQIRRLLAAKDDDAIASGRLSSKSVAVQGLSALEVLLHGPNAKELARVKGNTYRCRFALSIIDNLRTIVREALAAWADNGAFMKLWSSPGPDNPIYLKLPETTLELVKAFDQALLMVRDRRIVPAIGLGPKRRVSRPVLWRSGLGIVLIDANLRGIRDLFATGGLADIYLDSQKQADPSVASAIDSLNTEFEFLLDVTGDLANLRYPFKQSATRNRLIAIGFPLKSIRAQAVGRIKRAAGLAIGFNASDGD
ncbi:MAG: imelysin family protein [Hyphomicrobiaceae bacterium]